MAAKKILMLVGDYVEDYEVMVPFQALLMVGHTVHAVCPDKKAGEVVRTSVHDFEGDQTYSEKRGHNFALNATFAEVKPEDYDLVVIPGGKAPDALRHDDEAQRIVKRFFKEGKPVAAICHGPVVLINARVVDGRRMTGHPAIQRELAENGAQVVDAPVVVDGNLVTAPAWPAHPKWLAEFLKVLGTQITP